MFNRLRTAYQLWRIRPGVIFAASLADQQAWKHPNTSMLGPEINLLNFSVSLNERLSRADEGDLTGLYLDATTPIKRKRTPAGLAKEI